MFDFFHNTYQVDLAAAAGRARDDVGPETPNAQRAQDPLPRGDLFHRVGSKRDADRIADAVQKQAADTYRRFDDSAVIGTRGGNAEMQRIIAKSRHLPVGFHGRNDVGGLKGYDYIMKVERFKDFNIAGCSFYESCGRARAGRAGVHADADGYPRYLSGLNDLCDLFPLRDIPGVEPDLIGASLDARECQPVVEMNVADDWDPRALFDGFDRRGIFGVLDRHSYDLATRLLQLLDLGNGRLHIGGIALRHRLYRHGRPAAYLDAADFNLSRLFALYHMVIRLYYLASLGRR